MFTKRPAIKVTPHVKRPSIPVTPHARYTARPVIAVDPFSVANSQWREYYRGGQTAHVTDTVWNDPRANNDARHNNDQ